MSKLIKNEKGVSLLEVMIAILILGCGVLGLTPMFILSVKGNVIARDNSFVTNLIKEKIELYEGMDPLPALPFKDADLVVWERGEVGQNEMGRDTICTGYSSGDPGVFTRTVVMEDNTTDSLIPAGLVQITVAVSWLDHQNLNRSSSSSTYIFQ
ncbi:MAG: prepilin-type N-terminal cleavage/methylation domain-containing protein [Candidatus Zixiibacteriota bacterium]